MTGDNELITRRTFLRGTTGFLANSVALSSYAFGVEPLLRLAVSRYRLTPAGWPAGLTLRICALADIHAVAPAMGPERILAIAATANALEPDLTVLLGDYSRGHTIGWPVPPREWAPALGTLRAPLGIHAVLGNHDWWDDKSAQQAGHGPTLAQTALEASGIPVYHNNAVRLLKDGHPFWLAGLADQLALLRSPRLGRMMLTSLADLTATLAQVDDDAPVILLAHEPDIFPRVPSRVSLTLSGHTHGGQVRLFGYSPIVPSDFGNRFAYGHVHEDGRDLVVSGGLGCSNVPLRFGVPPELVLVELGYPETAA